MLRVIGTSESIPERIEFDEYIPVNVEWENPMADPPLYWRRVDQKSLLEVGINPRNRIIQSITLTAAENVECFSQRTIPIDIPRIIGIPIFDITGWPPDRYLDEGVRFDVYIGDREILLQLCSQNVLCSLVVSGRIGFGLNKQDELCLLQIVNLNQREVSQLKRTLRC